MYSVLLNWWLSIWLAYVSHRIHKSSILASEWALWMCQHSYFTVNKCSICMICISILLIEFQKHDHTSVLHWHLYHIWLHVSICSAWDWYIFTLNHWLKTWSCWFLMSLHMFSICISCVSDNLLMFSWAVTTESVCN